MVGHDPAAPNMMGFEISYGLKSILQGGPIAKTEWVPFSALHSVLPTTTPGMESWTFIIKGLPPGTWYVVAKAENNYGEKSDYSNEVSKTIMGPQLLTITSMSVAGNWYTLSCMATTSIKASAIFRYHLIAPGTGWSTIVATPTPTKTQHRAILYKPDKGYYNYEWTVTSADGTVAVSQGTFRAK